jgi:hypothetical protein
MRRVAFLLALTFAVPARATPSIDLYTMGAGDDLFSAFGHAAICVNEGARPVCYNYGTADFSTPIPLTWAFVRGRARFWVATAPKDWMMRSYLRADRSVWKQRLQLEPVQAEALAKALADSTDEKVKYYQYHHFNDNCTTRIRDLVDKATSGALSRDVELRDKSFRQYAREGFAGNWPLLAVTELLLGRSSDKRADSWSAMFLPSEMRLEVQKRLHAPPEELYTRKRPVRGGATWLGHATFAIGGAALALLLLLGWRLGRAGFRLALSVSGLVLGLVALILHSLAILSTFPELTRNEALFIFWPSDFALPFLSRPRLRTYALIRLLALALVLAGHLVGLTQPLSPLLLAALPLAVIALVARR